MTVVGASASTTPSSSTRTERDERSASTRTYGLRGWTKTCSSSSYHASSAGQASGRCPPIPAERRRGRLGPRLDESRHPSAARSRAQAPAVASPTLLIDQEAVIGVVQCDVVLQVVGHLPALL